MAEEGKVREVATLAGGCFWCVEAVFDQLKGVEAVESGYMGGSKENPTYDDICTGRTGHAEVIRVTFDPAVLSYRDLLAVFFAVHDPTTLNRQGNDVGTQYRSAIFFHTPEQEKAAREVIARLSQQKLWRDPVVTEVTAASRFYQAEDYHQEYFARVGTANPYCSFVIEPKVAKFRKDFMERLKR
ncbi:peptide-methionine (S)-S-oxide reductase MsrA [Usitatibacter palustris]|uniref:Peptide methionine sulfoxide reductase MsrA n=1 Tax=Usitatibacter palustris TaxID=2732487 RepID=A0A6M4HAI1_9PROT|nr:peptide-methionine (S)-S-oxide reductase MsrA [Usitatibacter palustris]QJR16809.1 Peptide methionine sulfoxide reductase MsrA [Usitatibacter palustris]